jgi:hypothetical protein
VIEGRNITWRKGRVIVCAADLNLGKIKQDDVVPRKRGVELKSAGVEVRM